MDVKAAFAEEKGVGGIWGLGQAIIAVVLVVVVIVYVFETTNDLDLGSGDGNTTYWSIQGTIWDILPLLAIVVLVVIIMFMTGAIQL